MKTSQPLRRASAMVAGGALVLLLSGCHALDRASGQDPAPTAPAVVTPVAPTSGDSTGGTAGGSVGTTGSQGGTSTGTDSGAAARAAAASALSAATQAASAADAAAGQDITQATSTDEGDPTR